MSKRKSTNSVLSFDVLNDINDWLADKNGENDETGDNLDELCSDSNPSEEWLEEEQQSEEPKDNVNRQQW